MDAVVPARRGVIPVDLAARVTPELPVDRGGVPA